MEDKRLFTVVEKQMLLSLYRELKDKSPETFEGKRYKQLKNTMAALAREGKMSHDLFDLNPVLRSMQTAILAVDAIGLKSDSVISCLLMPYITTEDQLQDIEKAYGKSVKTILHGLIHISELYKKSPVVESENFRNLLLSFAEDMRVILIMIADRVRLMRQIKDNTNDEARLEVSQEAAYLYAPLAHKSGLYKLKSELEDLSLKYLEHDVYYMIREKLSATKEARDEYIAGFIATIRQKLAAAGLPFPMNGRT